MKYTITCLLLLTFHVTFGITARSDTGSINLSANEDVLHNKSLLPVAASSKTFHIRENDTMEYSLQLALDKAGRPLYYTMNIFTPVCYTGECKPVFINFYWDLLGNYIRYDLPEKQVLTKLDHKEFKADDYEKLQEILAKPNSLLAELKMEDLIVPGTEKLTDSVDAKTGATLKTIKNEVISGAVYTCFTLWHIAWGPVVNEMQRITERYNSTPLLHRFLSSGNYEYQYWALDKVMDKKGEITPGFETDIRDIIGGKNIFIARYTLQKTDNDFFHKKRVQSWLWDTYLHAAYPLQLAILRKMKVIPLSTRLTEKLAAGISTANEEQRRMMLSLLSAAPSLSGNVLKQLADNITTPDDEKSAAVYQLLQQLKPENKYVKKKMYDYENSLNQIEK